MFINALSSSIKLFLRLFYSAVRADSKGSYNGLYLKLQLLPATRQHSGEFILQVTTRLHSAQDTLVF